MRLPLRNQYRSLPYSPSQPIQKNNRDKKETRQRRRHKNTYRLHIQVQRLRRNTHRPPIKQKTERRGKIHSLQRIKKGVRMMEEIENRIKKITEAENP